MYLQIKPQFYKSQKIGLKDLALLFCVVYVLVLSFLPSKKAHLQLAPKKWRNL